MDSGKEVSSSPAPTASKYLYASFLLFGLAQLLPWNVYIKSIPYFRYRLAGTNYSVTIASFMSSGFTLANFTTMLTLVTLRWDELLIDTRGRVLVGMAGNALIMCVVAIILVIEISQSNLFIMIVIFSTLAGSLTAFMIKGLLGMIARFPPSMTPSLLAGQAVAGLIVSLANAITTISSRGASDGGVQSATGPVVYLSICALTLSFALSIFICNYLWSDFFRLHMGSSSSLQTRNKEEHLEHQDNVTSRKSPSSSRVPLSLVWRVLKRIKWFAIGIVVTLSATISIFATFITSPRLDTGLSPATLLLYVPVVFIIYDCGDLLGRWLPAFNMFNFHHESKVLRLLPWMRLPLFLPLFALLAPVNVTGRTSSLSLIGASFGVIDIIYVVIAFTFGMSNGYCCTLLLMHAPALAILDHHTAAPLILPNVAGEEEGRSILERESCGALMGLFLNVGLVFGALSSFIWRLILS